MPLIPEVEASINDAFDWHPHDYARLDEGRAVRKALAEAAKTIVRDVPEGTDRITAFHLLLEVRIHCMRAIGERQEARL